MKKKLMTALALVLVIAMSVAGTYAYLTSTDSVTNTFTVGKVNITLNEAKVDEWGVAIDGADRVYENTYKLMPGHEYLKDPTVHVAAVSEDSWIFVKVENGISAFEAKSSTEANGYKSIAEQIKANGWTALENVDNVYYRSYTKTTTVPATATDLVVFSQFKIADDANNVNGWDSINADTTQITVTAYAVQKDGFNNASKAWNATFGQPSTTSTPVEGE